MTEPVEGRSAIRDPLLDYFDAAETIEDLADRVLRHLLEIHGVADKYLPVFRKRFIWADGEQSTLRAAGAEVGVSVSRVQQLLKRLKTTEVDLPVPPRLVMRLAALAQAAQAEDEFWELLRHEQLFLGDRVWPIKALRQLVDLVGGELISEQFSSRADQIAEPSDISKYRSALRQLRSGFMGWLDLRTVEVDLDVSRERARWLVDRLYEQVLGSGPLLVVNEKIPGPFLTSIAKVFLVTPTPTIDQLANAIDRQGKQRGNRAVGTTIEKRQFLEEMFGRNPSIPEHMREILDGVELLRHEVWFTQIFRSSDYGLLHRDQIMQFALEDGYSLGSIGQYLTYNPVVAPFGEGVFGLVGTSPREQEILFVKDEALDARPTSAVRFEYVGAQELEISLNLNFSVALGAFPVPPELLEAIGQEQFGISCTCGKLESNANVKKSSGFLGGCTSMAIHALRDHGRRVGDAVKISLNFETLMASLLLD